MVNCQTAKKSWSKFWPTATVLINKSTELIANWLMYVLSSLASQTFHSAKGEEKSGNLPILFWFAEFEIILRHVNGMLILCCHVQCPCTCRFQ